MLDIWKLVTQEDRIRVTQTPFRGAQGRVVTPGRRLASYYEYRDDEGRLAATRSGGRSVAADRSRFRPYLSRKDSETLEKSPEKTFLEVRLAQGTKADGPARRSDSAQPLRHRCGGPISRSRPPLLFPEYQGSISILPRPTFDKNNPRLSA